MTPGVRTPDNLPLIGPVDICWLLLTPTAAIHATPKKFKELPGLYYDHIEEAQLYNTEWRLLTYIDLQEADQNLESTKKYAQLPIDNIYISHWRAEENNDRAEDGNDLSEFSTGHLRRRVTSHKWRHFIHNYQSKRDTGKNKMMSETKHVSLLSCHRERQLYRMEKPVSAGTRFDTCRPKEHEKKTHHLWAEWWAAGTGQNEENCVFSLPVGGVWIPANTYSESTARKRVIKSGRVLAMFRKR